jgi:glycine/D-amino acid oxidase-like deaminating enzyme
VTSAQTNTTVQAQELAVIGSGPSGLAAAFRLQQAGHRVPGYWTAMRGFRKAGLGNTRIQLAGDYLCTSNLNTASTAGERAARDLLSHLLAA